MDYYILITLTNTTAMTYNDLFEQLSNIRKTIGLTRYEVSKSCGIRHETLARIEDSHGGSADAVLKLIAYYINNGLLTWHKDI